MIKNKRIVEFIVCIFIIIFSQKCLIVKAESPNNDKISITGNVNYEVKRSGKNNSKMVKKVLNNYPIKLCYQNRNGEISSVNIITDDSGSFSKIVESDQDIVKAWVEIKSENEACLVRKKVNVLLNNSLPYKYISKKFSVGSKQGKIYMNVSISNENVKGAINIARVINNARRFMINRTGIRASKITVYWTSGKGTSSYTITSPLSGEGIGMILSGKDHDERDESVICHEYGHWVFGTVRDTGRFMFGTHKDQMDEKLSFSEGLATFFGQTVLETDHYFDGNNTVSNLDYSIETPEKLENDDDYIMSEDYVSASLWDIIDSYNNIENWDIVEDASGDVLQSNVDVVMEADLVPPKIMDLINSVLTYDCSIQDFYNKYIENHITKNSNEAFNFWNIYNQNGMQFDKEKPIIGITDNSAFIIVDENKSTLTLKLFDNVKVSKVEFWIDGKLVSTVRNPSDTLMYTLPKNKLKNGKNKLAIKAYDYAGNFRTNKSTLSKVFPAEDFFKASNDSYSTSVGFGDMEYRQPYATKYIDLIVQGDEGTATASLLMLPPSGKLLAESSFSVYSEAEEDETISEESQTFIRQLADTYSLSYQADAFGTLSEGEMSSGSFTVYDGSDYGILLDDTLGDFEMTLTAPTGEVYSNSDVTEPPASDDESELQYVLNMGNCGMMLFNPAPGTWSYSIRNRGSGSDFELGIYTRRSAPIVKNEEELLKIQDGSSVELKASVVTGSAITVATGGAISAVSGSVISIALTGETDDLNMQDYILDTISESGDFTYTFHDLPDGHYKAALCVVGSDGARGWTKECEIIVDSKVPEILLEDDYEYFTYAGKAIIEGIGKNSSVLAVYLNGERIPVYDSGKSVTDVFFAAEMELKLGNNTLTLIAETETGRTVTKTLILHSETEEECYKEEHQPVIESVLFNGKEELLLKSDTEINVKLTDSNISDYKVFAICDDIEYDFIPNGDHFTLNFRPEEYKSGNYELTIYAVSRWLMYDYKEFDIAVQTDDGAPFILSWPEDIELELGESTVLNIDEIFGGNDYSLEANFGTISDNSWTFKPSEENVYEVTIRAFNEDSDVAVSFNVITESTGGFELQLDANKGEIDSDTYYVVYGEKYGTLPTPIRNGYNFTGWFTEIDGGTKILETTTVQEEDARILYAHWRIKAPVIIFDANGGNVSVATKKLTNGNTYGTLPTPTRTGYKFSGWFTKAEGGTEITSDTIVDLSDELIVYAHWGEAAYKVIFSANGGNVSVSNKTVTYGSTYGALPIPTRTNYIFKGWYTKASGGTEITEDSIVEITGVQILYAIWAKSTYDVTLDANGGEVLPNSISVNYGSTYGALPTPERLNYTFNGWYTEAEGGTLILSSSEVSITSPHTLYAHWTGNSYQLTLDANGGFIAGKESVSINIHYGAEYGSVLSAIATKDGYVFDGWHTEAEGGEEITSSAIVSIADEQTLYAHWKTGSYILTFNANGGSVSIDRKDLTYGSEYGILPVPIRKYYVFTGWYTLLIGGTEIKENSIVNTRVSQTLYAHWKGETFEVTFDANGGSLSQNKMDVIFGDTYGALPVPSKNNLIFDGWFTEATGGIRITNSSMVGITAPQTLYAHWAGDSYTVTLDANGGLISGSQTINFNVKSGGTYGSKLLLIPIRKEYKFLGWYTQASGGEEIISASPVNLTEDQIIYAHWKKTNYKVFFDANGGSVNIANRTVINGSTYGSLPVPIKANCGFKGWFTQLNGEIEITKDSIVDLEEDQTLYAHWNGVSYKVTLDATGGTVTQNSISVNYGESYGVLPIPARTGYRFIGWYTKENAGELITEESVVNISENHTLYAAWEENKYPVTLDANGGSFEATGMNAATIYVVDGKSYGYYNTFPVPARPGYDFEGWFTEKTGGTKVIENDIVTEAGEHTLYAHWKVESFIVYFYANGGEVSPDSKLVKYDERYGALPTPTRDHYIFLGWYDQQLGVGTKITEDSIVKIPASHSISARWLGEEYKVAFDANGGSVSQNSKNVNYGDSYKALPIPTRVGYSFVGWFDKASGGTRITESSDVTVAGNHTLYAQWEGITYSVELNPEGGVLNSSTKTFRVVFGSNYGKNIYALPVPSKTGYDFVGWYTEKDGGEEIQVNDIVAIAENHTLHAHWKEGNYTVYFYANGGNVSISSKVVTFNSIYGTLPIPTREHYVFDGWYDQKGSPVTEDSIMDTPGSSLSAHWKGEPIKVRFDANGGIVSEDSIDVIFGNTYGTLPVPTRTGYTFSGWYNQLNGGTSIYESSKVNIGGDHVLYAHWSGIRYTVTLDAAGGLIFNNNLYVSTRDITVMFGQPYSYYIARLPIPSKTGYEFLGWFTDENDGIPMTDNSTMDTPMNHTLYAHWKEGTYNVYFDANGGTVSINSKTVTFNNTYGSLPVPAREHYNFLGWYENNGITQITEGSIMNKTGNRLYARWEGEVHRIRFYANGGNLSQNSINVNYGNSYGALPVPSRDGYTFAGWFTQESGGMLINSSTIVNITADQSLYAHWNPNQYKISFVSNFTTSYYDAYVYYDGTYGNTLPIANRPGYKFLGWYTEENGGMKVTSDAVVKILNDSKLYARWEAERYVLSFEANGGKLSSTSKQITYDENYGALPTPTREHYIFLGWFDNMSAGKNVTADSLVNTTGNHTIYAHWEGETYTVSFDANGAASNPESIKVTYGNTYGTLPSVTRTGYSFDGWYTQLSGGERISSSNTVQITANRKLYAHWTIRIIIVTFYEVYGSTSTKEVYYDKPYGTLPTPSRIGYTFTGWYTDEKEGTKISESTIVKNEVGHILYAHWTPITYKIYLNANGGYVSEDYITVRFGDCFGGLPTPTREGYDFVGWRAPDVGGTMVFIFSDNRLVRTDLTTLYAAWNKIN